MPKIPISIDYIRSDGQGGIEITMDLAHFESSGASIRADIKKFKKDYLEAIANARNADSDKVKTRRVTTRQRWTACKILADFNEAKSNKFLISNYKKAYSRDFGIPVRSIREYLDFGKNFTEAEITDKIPFSLYAELIFRMNGLKAHGLFEVEKASLVQVARIGSVPNRDAYRERLKGLTTNGPVS